MTKATLVHQISTKNIQQAWIRKPDKTSQSQQQGKNLLKTTTLSKLKPIALAPWKKTHGSLVKRLAFRL
jgi:hypothetical protein